MVIVLEGLDKINMKFLKAAMPASESTYVTWLRCFMRVMTLGRLGCRGLSSLLACHGMCSPMDQKSRCISMSSYYPL